MRFGFSVAARAFGRLSPLAHLGSFKLHDPAQVRALIGREQARAARRRRPLSVVLFRAQDRWGRSALARLLLRRARETDAIGVLDENRLCTVLADTDEAGARHYAEQLHKLAAEEGIVIQEMVHTTPIPAQSGRDAEEAAARDLDWLDESQLASELTATNGNRRGAMRAFRDLLDRLAGSPTMPSPNARLSSPRTTATSVGATAAATQRPRHMPTPGADDSMVDGLAPATNGAWGS